MVDTEQVITELIGGAWGVATALTLFAVLLDATTPYVLFPATANATVSSLLVGWWLLFSTIVTIALFFQLLSYRFESVPPVAKSTATE